MVPSYCVLTVITRLLLLSVQEQLTRMAQGDFSEVEEVATLRRLLAVCRYAVCSETAVLRREEAGNIRAHLDRLPTVWQRGIMAAILAEEAGCAYHGQMMVVTPRQSGGPIPPESYPWAADSPLPQ